MSAGRCSALAATHVVASALALVIALAAAPLDAQTRVGVRLGIGAATLSGKTRASEGRPRSTGPGTRSCRRSTRGSR